MEKAIELGAVVLACSDSSGYIYDPKGIDVETIKQLKEFDSKRIKEYTKNHPKAVYHEGCTDIWSVACDIALPCATQNEMEKDDAIMLIENGVRAIGEGANMPCTEDAILAFQASGVLFAPAKAANAGGVAVSAMEMSQNSMRLSWTVEEVDEKLKQVMKNIYISCYNAAESYGHPGNLVIGANIAGFLKVADAMVAHGIH